MVFILNFLYLIACDIHGTYYGEKYAHASDSTCAKCSTAS